MEMFLTILGLFLCYIGGVGFGFMIVSLARRMWATATLSGLIGIGLVSLGCSFMGVFS